MNESIGRFCEYCDYYFGCRKVGIHCYPSKCVSSAEVARKISGKIKKREEKAKYTGHMIYTYKKLDELEKLYG
jgi:hypothetical protein